MSDASFAKPFMFVSDLVRAVKALEEEHADEPYYNNRRTRDYTARQVWEKVLAEKEPQE